MKALLVWIMATGACSAATVTYVDIPQGPDFPASEARLEAIRSSGDLSAQRSHMWHVFNGLTQVTPGARVAPFLTWFSAGEVFDSTALAGTRRLSQAFTLPTRPGTATSDSAAPPRITRAHYNLAAYRHIRNQQLFSMTRLVQLSDSVPAFPRDAIALKTVWWPVPANGVVALPVWDPGANISRTGGNDYPSWTRVVAVATGSGRTTAHTDVELMGKTWKAARTVGLDSLYHIELDGGLSALLMQDTEARKLAMMLLGRPLRAGDAIALVALHVATREITNWVWGTFWWHDAPNEGPYARGRPSDIQETWRHYLMNVSFDSDLPREADGRSHIAYNPWLEARFVDSGQGNGTVSNCVTCHARASTALVEPFAVTRGAPAVPISEPQVKTSFLWTLPMQAR